MAKRLKRIFISFAVEDTKYRDLFVGQARNHQSPFQFVDMSVKEPWDRAWKTRCRRKIKGCDGVIALISKKTWRAKGERWEIRCARDEHIPLLALHVHKLKSKHGATPPELTGIRVLLWRWDNIVRFVERL